MEIIFRHKADEYRVVIDDDVDSVNDGDNITVETRPLASAMGENEHVTELTFRVFL